MHYQIVVPENFEYVDRNLATASWWDRHEVIAGTYPVRLMDWNNVPAKRIEDVKYASFNVRSIVREEFRVSTLFTASSAHSSYPDREDFLWGRLYFYQISQLVDQKEYYFTTYEMVEGEHIIHQNAYIERYHDEDCILNALVAVRENFDESEPLDGRKLSNDEAMTKAREYVTDGTANCTCSL